MQWANIIVALERAIDSNSAKEFVQTYSIKMPSTTKEEVRGVIVIKTKLKSKAKEKKQALSLWKVCHLSTLCTRIVKIIYLKGVVL